MPDSDLTRQTVGEQYKLWRWRHDLTQREAAKRLRVSRWAYQAREASGIRSAQTPTWALGLLCRLARMRSGHGLEAVARMVGVSKPTIRAWESQNDPRLVQWWVSRHGYIFQQPVAK